MATWADIKRWESANFEGIVDPFNTPRLDTNLVSDDISPNEINTWRAGGAEAADGSEVTAPHFDSWWARLFRNIWVGQSPQYSVQLAQRRVALDECAEVDRAMCDDLARISVDDVTGERATGDDPLPGLPANRSTEEVAIGRDSLTEEEQQAHTEPHPDVIGSMGGVAGWAGDEAGRAVLERDLEPASEAWEAGDKSPEFELERNKLMALDSSISPADGEVRQPLLSRPATGDDGYYEMQAAVAIGDVDEADHLSAFVPVMTTTVGNSVENYAVDLRHHNQIAPGKLNVLVRDETCATIAWLGYDAPDNPLESDLFDSPNALNLGDFPPHHPPRGGHRSVSDARHLLRRCLRYQHRTSRAGRGEPHVFHRGTVR